MIIRDAAARPADLARRYPVVSVTGPRQAGKTTLCRATFPELPYVTLEPLDVREFAIRDPRGFLASLPAGAISDEVQRAPDLFSYLQAEVGANPAPGRFILTGSQQLGLMASVTQCWHPTFRKQVVKSAKLHLVDTGVASYLLGIREPDQLRTHPLRSALFESWVAAELVKRGAHEGLRRDLLHYRDAAGLEVDLVSTDATSVTLLEVKSGATIASDFADGVERLARGVGERGGTPTIATRVIHGGPLRQTRGRTQFIPWHEIDQVTWTDAEEAS